MILLKKLNCHASPPNECHEPGKVTFITGESGGPHPTVSPRVTDEMRLPMQDLLGEQRLANLSEEKSPEVLSPEAFIENDMCRNTQRTCIAH